MFTKKILLLHFPALIENSSLSCQTLTAHSAPYRCLTFAVYEICMLLMTSACQECLKNANVFAVRTSSSSDLSCDLQTIISMARSLVHLRVSHQISHCTRQQHWATTSFASTSKCYALQTHCPYQFLAIDAFFLVACTLPASSLSPGCLPSYNQCRRVVTLRAMHFAFPAFLMKSFSLWLFCDSSWLLVYRSSTSAGGGEVGMQ